MQIQIDLADDRHCDTCKLKKYSERYEVFNCAMGYWCDDEAETPIDSVTEEPVEFWDSDGTIVFMRPQICKDNHDAPPGHVYEFYMEEDTLRRRLYRIDKEPKEIEGLLKVYKRANRETYNISGWEAYLTSKLVEFVAIDEIDIDHSIYF